MEYGCSRKIHRRHTAKRKIITATARGDFLHAFAACQKKRPYELCSLGDRGVQAATEPHNRRKALRCHGLRYTRGQEAKRGIVSTQDKKMAALSITDGAAINLLNDLNNSTN